MKKFTLLFAFAILTMISFSQTPRLVLWEEFTSGSCGPCASVNPQITTYWNDNPDKVIGINYHMSWPAATDPMYLNNPSDNNARRGLYGVNSIPWASIDGDIFSDVVGSVNSIINLVETQSTNPSSFDLQLQYELNETQDKLIITALVTATEEVSNLNANLHLPVIEKHIHLSSSQPNGEQDFHNVMKALVPSSSGTSLKSNWELNDYEIYQFTWDVFGFYDIDEVGLIGFIQNSGSSKNVNQAASGSADAITPNYSTDMAITNIKTPQVLCNNAVSPIVTIRNQGATEITSASILYSVNGGETATYEWTGNLSLLESALVELPETVYPFEEMNTINIQITNPNGTSDEYIKNNTMILEIPQSAYLPQSCKVALLTDDNPEETTWDIKDSAGEIIAQGGPYSSSSIFLEPFEWTANDCFTFTIYDAGGNGLDGGFYKIVSSSNQLIWEGEKDFGAVTSAEFAYDEIMGINTISELHKVSVYPNPIIGTAHVEFTLLQQSTIQLDLYNILGKRVIQIYEGRMPEGLKSIQVNTADLEQGVYFTRLSIDGVLYTQKVNVLR